MDNNNSKISKEVFESAKTLKDYIFLVRINLLPFILISTFIIALAVAYAFYAKNIYRSTVTLKIAKQQQSILEATGISEVNDLANDRFIANEIEIITNYDSRERYARVLIDSFNNTKNKSLFSLVKSEYDNTHKSLKEITEVLKFKLSVEQISGVDMVEIASESPSPYEAALIANTCAKQYRQINLENNRNVLTSVRMFLEKQSKDKATELNDAENILKQFQERGGIVALDAQSSSLINQLSQLDAQRDAARVDLMTSTEILNQYKSELKKQDPHLVDYLESQTSQAYIDVLQKQIAELQMNRDLALANKSANVDVSAKVKDYDKRILELKNKLSDLINNIKSGAFASSPEQVKDLSQKLIEEEIKKNSLTIKLQELQSIIGKYEQNFNALPKKSIELAQYERKRTSLQQLYELVEQKHQESTINELSQPGNVTIVGVGRVPFLPSKPNRIQIVVIGIVAGVVFGLIFLLIKDYFNKTVKNPSDIQDRNIHILTWVPDFKKSIKKEGKEREFVIHHSPDSSLSEAFRSLRARLLFSRIDSTPLKTILVTSSAEGEGKTVTSINLAGSYAKSNKKVLLVDCDLRKPRVHKVFGINKSPGLVNYLFNQASLDKIIHRSEFVENFYYIGAGAIPPDPAEVLESKAMRSFLEEMKKEFDVVILDSAPIVAVIDSEILSKIVDGTILVVSAEKTEINLMIDAVNLLKKDNSPFLGAVLNNFKYKNGYGYYFKYYYNYSSDGKKGKKQKAYA